jgi:hypothetical protein
MGIPISLATRHQGQESTLVAGLGPDDWQLLCAKQVELNMGKVLIPRIIPA